MITKKYLNTIKLVATIGPSSWDPEIMKKLIEAGVTVARLNGAFADRTEMLKVENLVRRFSDKLALMIDIKGPEVRLNKFGKPIKLAVNQQLEFGSGPESQIYPVNYPDTYQKLSVGQDILVGDGDVHLEVTAIGKSGFTAKVISGQQLKPGKALNFPGLSLQEDPITAKDQELLEFAEERDWDFVSASFIRDAEAARAVRKALSPNSTLTIVAKIEDKAGVLNIEKILPNVDSVMIARGGLGVDLGLEKLAWAETKILNACIDFGKPAIMATQLLDSMERNPRPTRAEASDVGTSILNGADALMTSGETTAGAYPVEAITLMAEIDQNLRELRDTKIASEFNFKKAGHLEETIKSYEKLHKKLTSESTSYAGIIFVGNKHKQLTPLELIAKHDFGIPIVAMGTSLLALRQMQLVKGIAEIIAIEGIEPVEKNLELTQLVEKFSLSGNWLILDNSGKQSPEFREITL